MLHNGCNHGYSDPACPRFPVDKALRALRYSVTGETQEILNLVCIEESGYEPIRWRRLRYTKTSGVLEDDDAGEGIESHCMRAQALAFCRCYLEWCAGTRTA